LTFNEKGNIIMIISDIKRIIREEIQKARKVRLKEKIMLNASSMPGPGDPETWSSSPYDEKYEKAQERAETIYDDILASPEEFFDDVFETMLENEEKLGLRKKSPEFNKAIHGDITSDELEGFSEQVRISLLKGSEDPLTQVAKEVLTKISEKLAIEYMENGEDY
jgi:hypothetical protein